MKLAKFLPLSGRPGRAISLPGTEWLWAVTTAALFVGATALPYHRAVADDDAGSQPNRLSIDAGEADPKARLVTDAEAEADAQPTPATTETKPTAESSKAPRVIGRKAGSTSRLSGKPAAPGHAASPKMEAEAATFKGIQPGHSTRDDVLASWGQPRQETRAPGSVRWVFNVDPFQKVTVVLAGNTVQAVIVNLEKPVVSNKLAEHLEIAGITPVAVSDAKGRVIGEAYPERGVLFGYDMARSAPHVMQVVIEPLDPQPFLLRGEIRRHQMPAHSLSDAEFALELDPKLARAHWLRAECLRELGRYIDALPSAQQAFVLEPATPDYRVTLISLTIDLGDYARAEQHLDELLACKPQSPLVQAQANRLVGDCLVAAADHEYSKAVDYYQQAIKLAEGLTADANPQVRRAAKEVMVDAHLGVARAIAVGRWQQKAKIVPKWLARAKGFADDMVAHENSGADILQRVHNSAMISLAAVPGGPDARPWIDATQKLGRMLILEAEAQRRPLLEWQLGVALSEAVAIEHSQGRAEQALSLGDLAVKLLQTGSDAGAQTPGHDFIMGKLYYRLGAIAAMDEQNHKAAIAWYDKAVPLLQSPVPAGPLADIAGQGDMFISMAVSYWEVGSHEQAVRLTREGVRLIEQAVDAGLVSRKVLTVPYSNLATMFADMGDDSQAKHYAEMALRSDMKSMK